MAGGPLTWELILKDSFSPSAKKAGSSIDKLQDSFDAFNKALKVQTTSQEKWNAASEEALKIERQRTTQARKLAGQLEKVTRSTAKASAAAKSANSVEAKSGGAGGLGAMWSAFRSGSSAGRGGIGGVIDLVAGGGSGAALAFAGVAASVAAVAGAAYGAAKAFSAMGSAAMSASKWALEGLQFKESTLASFEVMTGSKSAASDLFGQAMGLSGKTPFGGADVAGVYKQLMAAGFEKKDLSTIFQAIGDVSALNGFDKGIFGQLAMVFGQIKGMGRLTTQDMRQMLGATNGIISQGALFGQIGKTLGVKASDVNNLISSGGVSDKVAINAFLKAIQAASGGKVGLGMERQSKTLAGQLSTLKDAPMQMIHGMDMEQGGFAKVKGFVENLNRLFDTTGETGKRFQSRLIDMFDSLWTQVFGHLTGEDGLKKIEDLAVKAFGALEKGVNVFKVGVAGLQGAMDGFISGLGGGGDGKTDWEAIGRKMAVGGELIGSALSKVVGAVIQVADFIAGHTKLMKFLGLLTPLTAGLAASSIASDAFEAFSGYAKAHPGGGEYENSTVGMEFAEGGIVNGPTRAVIGEAGPEAIVPLKRSHGEGLSHLRGGGGGVTVNVSLSVDARGNGSGSDIAHQVAMALPSAIADALEGLALEAGGAY